MKSEVTKEQIGLFLQGSNPMEKIVKIEGDYNTDKMAVIYRDENGKKKYHMNQFIRFVGQNKVLDAGFLMEIEQY